MHHLIERVRPLVFVLTQGDGHARVSRLASTTDVLLRAGAEPGSVYGRWRDGELYQSLLERRYAAFVEVVEEIAAAVTQRGIDCVVADAEERYNPSHDVCRYVASAVAACQRARGLPTRDLAFPLMAAPDALVADLAPSDEALVLHLDDDALARKMEAARQYPEMASEVDRALAAFGEAAFRTECLTSARDSALAAAEQPFYETYGEAQVASGKYPAVLRYEAHVGPLRERLRQLTTGGGSPNSIMAPSDGARHA